MHLILSALLLTISPPGTTVPVEVGLRLENITSVNEAAETWELEGELSTLWRDHRLAGKGVRVADPGTIWVPRMQFVNEVAPRAIADTEAVIQNDGQVRYVERFSAKLATDLNLAAFPFDTQTLTALVRPSFAQRGIDRIRIDQSRTMVDAVNVMRLSVWRRETMTASANDRAATFSVRLTRDWHVYLFRIILPLLALVCVSWAAFWLPIETYKTPDQLGLSMTALLTVVAFTFTVQAGLPRLSYMTYLDAFLLTSFITVLVGIGIIVVLSLGHLEQEEVVRARRIFRIVLPIIFIGVQLAILFGFGVA